MKQQISNVIKNSNPKHKKMFSMFKGEVKVGHHH